MINLLRLVLPGCLAIISLAPALAKSSSTPATPPSDRQRILTAIDTAMHFFDGHENQVGAQYGDYVVFCGLSVESKFPQYTSILDIYRKAIVEKDEFLADYPYYNSCHVMALDLIGRTKEARDIYEQMKASANDGKWDGAEYHLGWYLYDSIVAGDNALRDATLACLTAAVRQRPDKFHYFTAYCIWKIYERTKEKKYRTLFLEIVKGLKPFRNDYLAMAPTDGHMGMALTVFCTAWKQTKDRTYKDLCAKLAAILLDTQEQPGSWNEGNIAYTVMPAEGLTAFLDVR